MRPRLCCIFIFFSVRLRALYIQSSGDCLVLRCCYTLDIENIFRACGLSYCGASRDAISRLFYCCKKNFIKISVSF